MAEYYEIQIDDIFLTKDGLEKAAGIGQRCALQVDGVPALQSAYVKTRQNDMRNNPVIQKTEIGTAGSGRGLPIVVSIVGKLPVETAEMITALHRSREVTDTVIRLIGTDTDTPDFDVFVLPDVNDFTWGQPDGFGNYLGAVLRYVTIGNTSLVWGGELIAWDTEQLGWN